MHENLPQAIEENFFTKIKKWFSKIFKKQERNEHSIKENIEEKNKKIGESNQVEFSQSIKVENKDNILLLQKKLKENQIEISDLTDEELDEIIELYKVQIEEKKQKLKQYRIKIRNIKAT